MKRSFLRIIPVRATRAAPAALFTFWLLAGCSGDRAVREVQDLRLSGDPDSARARAVVLLGENATHMDLWLEFARSSLDACRRAPDDDGRAAEYTLQAGLVCGAVYRHQRREPQKQWQDASRMTAAEVTRQINRLVITFQVQASDAVRLSEIAREPRPGDATAARARQDVDGMVSGARDLLGLATVFGRLLDALPESTPGVTSLLRSQLESAVAEWQQALALDAGFARTVQSAAQKRYDDAWARALGDLQDLGYFLPATILDNGVLT